MSVSWSAWHSMIVGGVVSTSEGHEFAGAVRSLARNMRQTFDIGSAGEEAPFASEDGEDRIRVLIEFP